MSHVPDAASTMTALLGPTNTGKTHRALERMLEHSSGMMGLPLRLLAREIYDRATRIVGESQVALVTGEEKRMPGRPRYWVCTVEAMPVDRPVDFLAVDEIQLAAHPQRGHVFTDRLLHARGRRETWLMGADTMRPLIDQLVPTAQIRSHPRLSTLSSAGCLSLGSLPPRTAVVAFSSPQVYEVAERLRQRRGGTAVVLGALSPRTRNAQVALYQSGEVQYMVATDAIGMGLNMDVDLVAFASLRKFDGRDCRPLETAELAQIAGRAGRHFNDGRFATLAPHGPLPDEVTRAIETNTFPAVRKLVWRNSDVDVNSIDALIGSLRQRTTRGCLRLVEHADDTAALLLLASRPEIRSRARGPQAVSLLWEVCQIPDYRQLLPEAHAQLLSEIYAQLSGTEQSLSSEWMERRLRGLDDVNGDIDALMGRIAFVRTWTYVSNHGGWVHNSRQWQQRSREIEDRLSDALHEKLMARFVSRSGDGRGRCNRPHSRRKLGAPEPELREAFHTPFRALLGMKITANGPSSQPARSIDTWVQELVDAPHERFRIDGAGRIWDGSERIARIAQGPDLLHPEVVLTLEDDPGPAARLRISRRLVAWSRDLIEQMFEVLRGPQAAQLSPAARGLVYQLEQRLGTVREPTAREQIGDLTALDRRLLRSLDVQLGRRVVFVRALLKPPIIEKRVALCCAYASLRQPLEVPRAGVIALVPEARVDESLYAAIGYPVVGGRAIRADFIEKIDALLARATRKGPCQAPPKLRSWLRCSDPLLRSVVEALGYRWLDGGKIAGLPLPGQGGSRVTHR
jgi:ATP-dependent RNA helicase SUPV3L1/SUV3